MPLCLVTGATGFIGSNLSAQLVAQGARVRILRRSSSDLRILDGIPVQHCPGDLADPVSLRRAMTGCDVVYHAAALVSFKKGDRRRQHEVNVEGTRALVEACLAEHVPRLVHVSSIAAIGHPQPGEVATEETAFNWGSISAYRETKHMAEGEVLKGVERGLSAVIVNPSVVVGERDIHFHGGEILRSVKRGLVRFYPEGGMNVAYVGDVVEGMIAAAQKGRTGNRYILGGENLSYRDVFTRAARLIGGPAPIGRLPSGMLHSSARLVETVCGWLNLDPPITGEMVAGTTRNNWYSSDKAVRELGYRISGFDRAILAAWQWYRAKGML
jgi:dihydroflavonol-4-reductase